MINGRIITELDFVLTHPACKVENLERFYQNSLFTYDTVPLMIIINHLQKSKPNLLKEWSIQNNLVGQMMSEMGLAVKELEDEKQGTIRINVDIEKITPSNGFYKVVWTSDLDENYIQELFKRKEIRVLDETYGFVELVGLSKEDANDFNLYIKKRED